MDGGSLSDLGQLAPLLVDAGGLAVLVGIFHRLGQLGGKLEAFEARVKRLEDEARSLASMECIT
jgi:hypothetical protein